MYSQGALLSALVTFAEARFGQEQIPVSAITALSNFGSSGQAASLAGGVPGVLLAAADPCAKLKLADEIVTTLGTDSAVITGAKMLVAAEQNFNPFVASVPNICGNATRPATAELRGIVPLVDPAVIGSDTENAHSATSLETPFNADGLSVAEVMVAAGFSNFTVNGAAVAAGDASADGDTAAATASSTTTLAPVACGGGAVASTASVSATNPAGNATAGASSADTDSSAAGAGAVSDPVSGTFTGFQASSLGLDFGTCTPTVKFEESLNGRGAGEFTFQAQDPVVNKGQQEALNPSIIFNRICDQLINVCGAADDAHTACKTAQADLGGGARDATTADAWNTALGFAGTDINPDNAPQAGLVGHT